MDRRPVKTTGMRAMTTLAEERNRRDQEELVARMRAARMRRRMSAMREGVHRRTHRQTKSAVKTGVRGVGLDVSRESTTLGDVEKLMYKTIL